MFLEDILDKDEMRWAKNTQCVEVEFIYTTDVKVPCYSTLRYVLPSYKTAKVVKDNIFNTLDSQGNKVLNVCMTTWTIKEYLESCFEKCHNEKYIKTTLKFLMKGE